MGPNAQRWADELAAWAIPDEILAQAPESPWFFPPEIFKGPRGYSDTPTRSRGREALGGGGTVLDVGCGGGAAGLALVPPATRVVGFDPSAALLEVFEEEATRLGVDHGAIEGSWPADSARAPVVDVVVSNHVVYNVADLVTFARALGDHARRRVVVEMSAYHPLARMTPLWRHFWGIDRPDGPSADLALSVLDEAGIAYESERAPRQPLPEMPRDLYVAFTRRRLCLPAERDPEVDAVLPLQGEVVPGESVTIWWRGTAG